MISIAAQLDDILRALAHQCAASGELKIYDHLLVRMVRQFLWLRWLGDVFARIWVYKCDDHWRVMVDFPRQPDNPYFAVHYWIDDNEPNEHPAFDLWIWNRQTQSFDDCQQSEKQKLRRELEHVIDAAFKQFVSRKSTNAR